MGLGGPAGGLVAYGADRFTLQLVVEGLHIQRGGLPLPIDALRRRQVARRQALLQQRPQRPAV